MVLFPCLYLFILCYNFLAVYVLRLIAIFTATLLFKMFRGLGAYTKVEFIAENDVEPVL
jgi:hypothetical protein